MLPAITTVLVSVKLYNWAFPVILLSIFRPWALFAPLSQKRLGKINEEALCFLFLVPRPRRLKESKRALGTKMTVIIILGKGRNERQTENRILLTYCLVTSCLLLEVLICVVLLLCLWKNAGKKANNLSTAQSLWPHDHAVTLPSRGVWEPA